MNSDAVNDFKDFSQKLNKPKQSLQLQALTVFYLLISISIILNSPFPKSMVDEIGIIIMPIWTFDASSFDLTYLK